MKKTLFAIMLMLPLIAGAQQVEKLQKKVAAGDTKSMIELARWYECGHGVAVDSAQALQLIQKAADMGDADAMGHLSRYYRWYTGVERDSAKVLQLAKQSADKGSSYGIYRMALCYFDGIGVDRNVAEGKRLVEQAVARGEVAAIDGIALDYMQSEDGYAHDVAMALKYYKKVPDSYITATKFASLARYYASNGDFKTAKKWLDKGCAVDNLPALIEAARFRFFGWGETEDEQGAMAELARLEQKYPGNEMVLQTEIEFRTTAQDESLRDEIRIMDLHHKTKNYSQLGDIYYFGAGVSQDSMQAVHYWRLGAAEHYGYCYAQLAGSQWNAGNMDSLFYYANLSRSYFNPYGSRMLMNYYTMAGDYGKAALYGEEGGDFGDEELRVEGGKRHLWAGDTAAAMRCFDRAIENYYFSAYSNKAELMADLGDVKGAVRVLEQGFKSGDGDCGLMLGRYYESQGNYKKAADYYAKAGTPDADYELAGLYMNGSLGTQSDADMQKAIDLLRRSAAGGSRDGNYWLAYSYGNGIGCEQNYDSALHYYSIIAENGDAQALGQLAVMYEHGRGVAADTLKAMEYYEKSGDAGLSVGYAYLGDFYRNGYLGNHPDSARAFEYYKKAAEIPQGNAAGLYYVGDSYLRGIGVSVDTSMAIGYMRQAVAAGSPMAAAFMGDLYYYGLAGYPVVSDSAIYYYYTASQGDNPRGDYMMGKFLYDEGNYDKAMGFITSAAQHGSADAYVLYSRALLNGEGVERDPERAYVLLKDVAENANHAEAYMLLGTCHFMGLGCKADTLQAKLYFDTAAAFGNSRAMMNLGVMYANGLGVKEDTVAALLWYEKAAATGSANAMLTLAKTYASGQGAPKDLRRAAELYQQAADKGNLDALCYLGLCYEEGEGVILNSRKAYNLYMQAAERGSAWGMYLVSMCYIEGVYVQEDEVQAAEWMTKAAENGHVVASYYLGQMYANGLGLKKDKKKAREWLSIAAEAGFEPAVQALSEL